MRRGEIRLVDLGPVPVPTRTRCGPAVIVGNNGANAAAQRSGSGVLTVVPVTSNVTRIHPFRCCCPLTGVD